MDTEITYFFDKTYNGINFKISHQYIDENEFVNTLIIEEEYIDEIDVIEIAENKRYFQSMIPDYVQDLIDVSDVVKDVNESMEELYKTWQW